MAATQCERGGELLAELVASGVDEVLVPVLRAEPHAHRHSVPGRPAVVVGGVWCDRRVSFTDHLAGLDEAALTALFEHRPDVLVEPAPRGFGELALRLNGHESLAAVLPGMDRDQYAVVRALALIGPCPPGVVAARLRSSEQDVVRVAAQLGERGLAWAHDGRLGLPPRLAEHYAAELAGFRPLAAIANQARVDELRVAVAGLGGDADGPRKPELVAVLRELVSDPDVVLRAVSALAPAARQRLAQFSGPSSWFARSSRDGATALLVRAGLLVGQPYGSPELPREIVATLAFGDGPGLSGRPELPRATDPASDGRAGAEGALLALTTLLDEAVNAPLAALKKGGVGTRERTRLATRLGVPEPALWIDIAHTAGLLTPSPAGYAAAAEYPAWREGEPHERWARAVLAWWALDVAPTHRMTDDGEVPPPVPLESAAGLLRRALLGAAAAGLSLRAAGDAVDWFAPLHPYDQAGREHKIDAALREAALLGVVVGDRLSALGELLVEVAGRPDAHAELVRRSAALLPAGRGMLVLQSDLTAVVSGQPSARAARLLATAATAEGRGAAATWRFTPASVRAALDDGWTAGELRAGLVAISDKPLPQPLDYLIADVARRHGSVRLRGSRTCVTGSEAEIAEILHTRGLTQLHLSRLAPTVLTSPFEIDAVLAKLRKAGFSPMPEDADGVVIVAERKAGPAPARRAPRATPRVPAAALAARLRAGEQPTAPAHAVLAAMAPRLDAAEVALLAHAVEHEADIRITYRNAAGNRTVREIRPQQLFGRWIRAWCHLRSAEREFSVAGIEAVAPVG